MSKEKEDKHKEEEKEEQEQQQQQQQQQQQEQHDKLEGHTYEEELDKVKKYGLDNGKEYEYCNEKDDRKIFTTDVNRGHIRKDIDSKIWICDRGSKNIEKAEGDENRTYTEKNIDGQEITIDKDFESFKKYCPIEYPKNRSINGMDDFICTKNNLCEFKNDILKNLNIDNIYYDLNKIEHKKNLLNNEDCKNKKWYLNFQPLNNISIEQYWKYEKVTLQDILTSNINLSEIIDLKKNKKYLKYISRSILKGNPHESLIKNSYKYTENYINTSELQSRLSLTNINPSILSSKTLKNTQNLLKWKLKYANNTYKTNDHKYDEAENSSSLLNTHNFTSRSNNNSTVNMEQANSQISSNKRSVLFEDPPRSRSSRRYV
ncbi:hypothetical protein PFAG_01141 [Plasmodium falciparum Santa Lucia]|uniref:Uncharacterized protein n=1 Tax=Plasmodium falciparum Santa Lucia TaxID=478859 RepID=W7FNT2_PLAFA|nr:hypothetical protein PFAG_01141 [Plasmodium falciparum Santa Lucia]